MGKSLLLISSHPQDKAFASIVAVSCALTLKICNDPHQGAAALAQEAAGSFSAIFVDGSNADFYSKFETALQETVGLFSDRLNANQIHFFSNEPLHLTPYLTESPLLGHFILRNFENIEKAAQHYSRLVRLTFSDKEFGLASFFGSDVKIQTVKLLKSSQKQDAVEATRQFLIAAKFKARMAISISNAVDEILMNSVYDAPVDALGKPLYVSSPRTAELDLSGPSEVELQIGFNGTHIALSATDLYGSLDKVRLMSHLARHFATDEYKIKSTKAGAGIGLASIFKMGGSLFFRVDPQSRTEVTVIFERKDNHKTFKGQFKFISTLFYT